MATETEQNTGDPPKLIDEVRVIAIKLPFDLQERILSFPFIHAIRERYPIADLHFITPKENIEVLNLLPFSAYYHEFDENDIQTVFDAHRFCVNAKIFNVDVFISLTNLFVDACLGLGLRAKKRVGFSDGWKTLVLTHKTPRPVNHHVVEDFMSLYKELTGENVDLKIKVMSRDLVHNIPEWESRPYIAINLSPLRRDTIEDDFLELISYFENQRIVLFASEDQDEIKNLIQPFLAKLSAKNVYIHFVHKDWIDLAKMLSFAKGVITFNGPAASFSAYTGSKTLILFDSENPQKTGPFYFLADFMILGVNDPNLVNTQTQDKILLPRKTFIMSEVFGKAHDFFKL